MCQQQHRPLRERKGSQSRWFPSHLMKIGLACSMVTEVTGVSKMHNFRMQTSGLAPRGLPKASCISKSIKSALQGTPVLGIQKGKYDSMTKNAGGVHNTERCSPGILDFCKNSS